MKSLITIEELSLLINKSVTSIRSDRTRNPKALPPICKLPGTKRLLWRIEDVESWIQRHVILDTDLSTIQPITLDIKPRRGRPTKADQISRANSIASLRDVK